MAKEAVDQHRGDFGQKPGPGYEWPDRQTVLYEPTLEVIVPFSSERYPVDPATDRLPTSGKAISVFTTASKLKKPAPNSIGVALDDRGAVLVIRETADWDIVAIPENGSVLVGTGAAPAGACGEIGDAGLPAAGVAMPGTC